MSFRDFLNEKKNNGLIGEGTQSDEKFLKDAMISTLFPKTVKNIIDTLVNDGWETNLFSATARGNVSMRLNFKKEGMIRHIELDLYDDSWTDDDKVILHVYSDNNAKSIATLFKGSKKSKRKGTVVLLIPSID